MLIVALALAVIGLAALVAAVVTSNELIAWVCIAASVIGVILLIIDAVRERSRPADDSSAPAEDDGGADYVEDYPDYADADAETTVVEQADEEIEAAEPSASEDETADDGRA